MTPVALELLESVALQLLDPITLQLLDPATLLEAPPAIRAGLGFVLILAVGGAILYRDPTLVENTVDATLERPLTAIGYGLAAHLVIAFVAVYLASQFALVTIGGVNVGGLGPIIGGLIVLYVGGLGFTAVGAGILTVWGTPNHASGVVIGAAIAGAIAVADPPVIWLAWVAVVSLGIGGAVREWIWDSYDPID